MHSFTGNKFRIMPGGQVATIKKMQRNEDTNTTEKIVISDYVRLCITEGKKPDDAYNEMKRKLQKLKESKSQ
jgi:hypothetical protein